MNMKKWKPLKSELLFLPNYLDDLDEFNKLKIQEEKVKKQRTNVPNTASDLYKNLPGIYFDEYYELLDAKK